jgi:hypothetical protein
MDSLGKMPIGNFLNECKAVGQLVLIMDNSLSFILYFNSKILK